MSASHIGINNRKLNTLLEMHTIPRNSGPKHQSLSIDIVPAGMCKRILAKVEGPVLRSEIVVGEAEDEDFVTWAPVTGR